MKKLALASAIAAATMASMTAHAGISATTGAISIFDGTNYIPSTVSCASTYLGGADGIVLNVGSTTAASASGTVCLDPGTGVMVMIGISMAGSGSSPISMNQGVLQVATDYPGTTSGWIPYGIIDLSLSPVSCTATLSPDTLTCSATLLSYPAILTM
jgi:hypothetical protein